MSCIYKWQLTQSSKENIITVVVICHKQKLISFKDKAFHPQDLIQDSLLKSVDHKMSNDKILKHIFSSVSEVNLPFSKGSGSRVPKCICTRCGLTSYWLKQNQKLKTYFFPSQAALLCPFQLKKQAV